MFLSPNPPSIQLISSFESIEFKLSENLIPESSRYLSIEQINDHEPTSLTYTQTYEDFNNKPSLRSIEAIEQDHEKENFFSNIDQICLATKNLASSFVQYIPKKLNNFQQINMKKKNSIISIQNIELFLNQKDKNFKNSPRLRNQRFKSKVQAIQTPHIPVQPSNVFTSIVSSKTRSKSRFSEEDSFDTLSILKKRSISSMKTQDKSILSSATKSERKKISRSQSQNQNICLTQPRIKRAVSAASCKSNKPNDFMIPEKQFLQKDNLQQLKSRKHFLQDPISVKQFINIKSIKLGQNTLQSKAYLRKIIQNRVSIHHYAESNRFDNRF